MTPNPVQPTVGRSFLAFYHVLNQLSGVASQGGAAQLTAFTARAGQLGLEPKKLQDLLASDRNALIATLWRLDLQRGTSDPLTTWHDLADMDIPEWAEIAKERALWAVYDGASLPSQFDHLSRLMPLYVRRRGEGGRTAIGVLGQTRNDLAGSIRTGNRYWELVAENPNGLTALSLSGIDLELPPFLVFPSDVPKPPILFSPQATLDRLGYWAYFRRDSLAFYQDIICLDCVAKFRNLYQEGASVDPIQVSYDRDQRLHHIWDGYHRTAALIEQGVDYVLGRVVYNYSSKGPRQAYDKIRRVRHQEHLAIIRLRNGDQTNPVAG